MKKFLKVIVIGAALVLGMGLKGCMGPVVEIPPAHVAKISTPAGMQKGVIPPSKTRLDGWCLVCDSITLLQAGDAPLKEPLRIFMPKDELNFAVDIRGTYSIDSAPSNVDKVFSNIATRTPVEGGGGRVNLISQVQVYVTYAQPILRDVARSVISKYTIPEILVNKDAVGAEIEEAVRKRLEGSPISISYLGLADVQPPEVIVLAKEAEKKRAIEIQQEENSKQIRLKKAEADLLVATKQQEIELKEAETTVLVEQKLAGSVSPQIVTLRALKALETMMANPNGKVFFVTEDVLQNPAALVGVMQKGMK